jgi:hypothetical protein
MFMHPNGVKVRDKSNLERCGKGRGKNSSENTPREASL